jgi:type IV secretion system protein VirB10
MSKTKKPRAPKEELNQVVLEEEAISAAENLNDESGAEVSYDEEMENESGAEVSYDEEPKNELAEELEDEDSEEDIDEELEDEDSEEDIDEEREDEGPEEVDEELEDEEDHEVDIEEYEKLRKDLLQEYEANKNTEQAPEQPVQASSIKQDVPVDVSSASHNKVSIDEDLEIEDIEENLDDHLINRPKTNVKEDAITPDIDQGISKVAISKGSSITIIVIFVLVMIYVIYKMFQPSEEELNAKKSTLNSAAPIVQPVEDAGQTIVVPEVPKFPDMPKELTPPVSKVLAAPPAPSTLDIATLTPPPSPAASTGDTSSKTAGGLKPLAAKDVNVASVDKAAAAKEAADAARRKARIRSSMMAGGGGGGGNKSGVNSEGQSLSILQRNSAQTVATHIGDLQRVIAAGKVIDAVLETAINTDLPGMIRAIVSRDIYSEAGKNILITKGSRLIGTYGSTIKFGQARVQIVWDRIIRPDGIDIKVASPGIDDIGRSGSAGDVDNHILRNFATAMMISMINIGIAEYAEKNGASASTSTTTTNTDGSSTNTDDSSPVDQAYDDAVNLMGDITKDVVDKTTDMPPTITVDQGTSLKVFVKQDLVFPGRAANLTRMIDQ